MFASPSELRSNPLNRIHQRRLHRQGIQIAERAFIYCYVHGCMNELTGKKKGMNSVKNQMITKRACELRIKQKDYLGCKKWNGNVVVSVFKCLRHFVVHIELAKLQTLH